MKSIFFKETWFSKKKLQNTNNIRFKKNPRNTMETVTMMYFWVRKAMRVKDELVRREE